MNILHYQYRQKKEVFSLFGEYRFIFLSFEGGNDRLPPGGKPPDNPDEPEKKVLRMEKSHINKVQTCTIIPDLEKKEHAQQCSDCCKDALGPENTEELRTLVFQEFREIFKTNESQKAPDEKSMEEQQQEIQKAKEAAIEETAALLPQKEQYEVSLNYFIEGLQSITSDEWKELGLELIPGKTFFDIAEGKQSLEAALIVDVILDVFPPGKLLKALKSMGKIVKKALEKAREIARKAGEKIIPSPQMSTSNGQTVPLSDFEKKTGTMEMSGKREAGRGKPKGETEMSPELIEKLKNFRTVDLLKERAEAREELTEMVKNKLGKVLSQKEIDTLLERFDKTMYNKLERVGVDTTLIKRQVRIFDDLSDPETFEKADRYLTDNPKKAKQYCMKIFHIRFEEDFTKQVRSLLTGLHPDKFQQFGKHELTNQATRISSLLTRALQLK